MHYHTTLFVKTITRQTQDICITFVERRTNFFDVGPALYKCYTNVLCLQGSGINRAAACFCSIIMMIYAPCSQDGSQPTGNVQST